MKANVFKIIPATCITVKVIDGWPCISESLQWAEECPLYLMGQYAALQVGLHLQEIKTDVKLYSSPKTLKPHFLPRRSVLMQ